MKLVKENSFILLTVLILFLTSGLASAYNQAPVLDQEVENGNLPAVDERLPENPYVTEVVDRIGDYGGTLNWFATNATDDPKLMALYNNINLVRYTPSLTIKPDLAESYEVSDDLTTYTFNLRKGIRWSDGELFTANDVMFWFNDIIKNDQLTAESGSGWLKIQDKLPEVEKLDDYTVRFSFAAPNPYFLEKLAFPGRKPYAAAHYLKQFHADYADQAELEKRIADSDFDKWVGLFESKNSKKFFRNPELPVIEPWVPVTEPPANRFVYKRNPYFYKVDEEGNQLPYLDEVVLKIVSDKEVLSMQVVSGAADLQMRQLMTSNFTLYKNNEKSGNYKVLKWQRNTPSLPTFAPNITYAEDEWMRELNNNKKFRQALSLAINRPELNQVATKGLAVPRQATVYPQWEGFKQEWADAYADYDPERANKLLDEAGFTERNSDGIRLKDGKPIHLTIYIGEDPNLPRTMNMIKDYWKDIGVDMDFKGLEKTLHYTRRDANKLPWAYIGGASWSPTYPYNFIPVSNSYSSGNWWAPLYAKWYETNGKQGEEPPAEIKKLMNLYDEIQITKDQDKRVELWQKVFDIHAENVWMIGTNGLHPQFVIKKNYVHNVPETALASWDYGAYFGPSEFYQFFIEKDAQDK